MLLYDGPSTINNADILGILTPADSKNPKTGKMAQLFIVPKNVDPCTAIKSGDDESVCGKCKHRYNPVTKKRVCYVNQMGINAVYKKWRKGGHALSQVLDTVFVRLGAYGDPCALPLALIVWIVNQCKIWTGYTHQWKNNPDYMPYLMASVDSEAEYYEATTAGWRTFRVKRESDPILPGEIVCPYATKGIQCIKCGLCRGTSIGAKNIVINVHGIGKKGF